MDLLAHSGVHLLETLFFLGLLGSIAVVLLSLTEDIRESLAGDDAAKDEPA